MRRLPVDRSLLERVRSLCFRGRRISRAARHPRCGAAFNKGADAFVVGLVLARRLRLRWGRSMGVVSYEDTMEIVGFLARHPEVPPRAVAQLASAYYQAWRTLRQDYNDKTHVLSVFAFGPGTTLTSRATASGNRRLSFMARRRWRTCTSLKR